MWAIWALFAFLSLAPATARAGETITYTYDNSGRLRQVDHAGSVNAGLKSKYTYDDADNRATVVVTGAPHAAAAAPAAKPRPKIHS